MNKNSAYAKAGVDLEAGNRATDLIKTAVQSTFTPDVQVLWDESFRSLDEHYSFGNAFHVHQELECFVLFQVLKDVCCDDHIKGFGQEDARDIPFQN